MNTNALSKFAKDVQVTLSRHSPEILMGMGIAGMITTTILAVRATPKALELIEDRKDELEVDSLPPVEVVKTTWKCYVPATITGVASIACLIGSNSVNTRRNAALATAYKISETAFAEYREQTTDLVGEKKEKAIRDRISEKQVKENPISNTEVIITGKGQTLCFDPFSSRYFYSDIEKLKRAANTLNYQINTSPFDNDGVTLNDFYREIGMPETKTGDSLGWNLHTGLIEIYPSAQLVEEGEEHEGEPCIVLNFTNPPRYDDFL